MLRQQVREISRDLNQGLDPSIAIKGFGKIALIIAAIAVVVKAVQKAWAKLSENKQFAEKVQQIKDALANLFDAIIMPLVNLLIPIIDWIIDSVYKLLQYVNTITKQLLGIDIFAKGMKNAAGSAKEIKKSLAGFDDINQLKDNENGGINSSAISNAVTGAIAGTAKIKELFNNLWKWMSETFGPGLSVIWDYIKLRFKSLVEFLSDNIKNGIKVFDGLLDFLNGIFEKDWKKAWNGVKNIFAGVWAEMKNIIKFSVNAIIDVLNLFIYGFNKIIYPIRQLIVSAGSILGQKWSIDSVKIPNIPRLANGGIVNVPSKGVNIGGAVAGEAGAEAVIPLTDDTLQRLANMIPITIDLTNTIDGRILNKQLEIIRRNNNFARNGGF